MYFVFLALSFFGEGTTMIANGLNTTISPFQEFWVNSISHILETHYDQI